MLSGLDSTVFNLTKSSCFDVYCLFRGFMNSNLRLETASQTTREKRKNERVILLTLTVKVWTFKVSFLFITFFQCWQTASVAELSPVLKKRPPVT